LTLVIGCGGGGGSPDASTAPDAAAQGTITFAWTMNDPDSAPLTCDDVGGVSVRITATPAIGGFAQVDAFDCALGSATTHLIDPVNYNVAFRLTANVGGPQALADDVTMNGVKVNAGADSNIGSVAFEVVPSGGFHFTVTADIGPNCPLVADGGAEITAFEVELVDATDTCVPTDFCIDDADTAAGCQGTLYSNDCAGATTACVDSTAVWSVVGAVSGPHRLQITGHRNAEACFYRDAQIQIPGANLDRNLGSQLVSQTCGVDAAP
jgi:hypothetical protein